MGESNQLGSGVDVFCLRMKQELVALKLDTCDAAALIKGCMLGGQGLTVHIKFSVLLPTTSGMDPNNSFNKNIR